MKLKSFFLAIEIFICWLLLLSLFYLTGNLFLGDSNNLSLFDLANWDGRHFLSIAQYGYLDKIQYAFFPLYPALINILAQVFNIDFFIAAILINLFSNLGSIYIFILIQNKSWENSIKTIFYFLVFPTSFYLVCVYSESLFLFLALITFWFAAQKKLFIAALFASMASLCRVTGISVIASLLVYLFLTKMSLKKKILIFLISISGILSYCIYLYFQTGNPFYFLISEISWGRHIMLPGVNVYDSIFFIANEGVKPESFTIFSDLIFTILGIGLGIRAIRFLKLPFIVYTTGALLLPLTTALLLSVPRFLIVVFPIFMVLSKIKNSIFNICYIIISIVLLFLYFNFFLRNIWVS